MRIELLYSPGCSNYKKALSMLEYIIAEEQLPLPVELVEDTRQTSPSVRIDGELQEKTSCHETVRSALREKWTDRTAKQLLSA